MVVTNENYKLEILSFAINQFIDSLLPQKPEDALNVILHNSNEVVWRVTTEIYSKSGYQIDFLNVKEILNSRIEPLQRKIARAEKIRKEQEAEQERIIKEIEANQARIKKELETGDLQKLETLKNIYSSKKFGSLNEHKIIENQVITRVKNIISEELDIKVDEVTFEARLTTDLGADELDAVELIMAIEEEFDIEIPDTVGCYNHHLCSPDIYIETVSELIDFVSKQID